MLADRGYIIARDEYGVYRTNGEKVKEYYTGKGFSKNLTDAKIFRKKGNAVNVLNSSVGINKELLEVEIRARACSIN